MEVPCQALNSIIRRIDLSPKEANEGRILHSLQVASIMNLRADIAEEILALTYEPKEPTTYGVKLAYLQGQLDILTHLLSLSVDTTEELNNPSHT